MKDNLKIECFQTYENFGSLPFFMISVDQSATFQHKKRASNAKAAELYGNPPIKKFDIPWKKYLFSK